MYVRHFFLGEDVQAVSRAWRHDTAWYTTSAYLISGNVAVVPPKRSVGSSLISLVVHGNDLLGA